MLESQLPGQRTVAVAMFTVLLKMQYDIWVNPGVVNMLCRALLIVPDLATKTCPDMADLEASFPNKMKDG
jgi:hypothetical protein